MKIYLFTLLCFVAYLPANAEDKSTDKKQNMNNYKKDVTLWYEAFTKKDAALLDKILHETWVDIPSPPGTAPGPEGVKPLFARLTTTFPDLKLTIEDILQDGNKVVVRARMAGTQKEAVHGFSVKESPHRHSGCGHSRVQRRENCSNLAHRGLDERPSSIGCFREIVGGKSASTESRKELYVAKRYRKSRGPPQYGRSAEPWELRGIRGTLC